MKSSTLSLTLIFLLFLTASCERDIDMLGDVTPRIVVNSILTPDSTITVNLFWSLKMGGREDYERVEGAQVNLTEDGIVIFSGTSGDAPISTGLYPKAGAKYGIEVLLDGQPPVTASTTVPEKPYAESCTFLQRDDDEHVISYQMGAVTSGALTSCIILRVACFYVIDGKEVHQTEYSSVNALAPFADQFNKEIDTYSAGLAGSFDFYSYLRVVPGNAQKVFPLKFAAYLGSVRIESGEYSGKYVQSDHRVLVRAASHEYDRYYKTLKQYQMTENPDFITFESQSVYSNVKNGLGIFASHNTASFYFEYDYAPPNNFFTFLELETEVDVTPQTTFFEVLGKHDNNSMFFYPYLIVAPEKTTAVKGVHYTIEGEDYKGGVVMEKRNELDFYAKINVIQENLTKDEVICFTTDKGGRDDNPVIIDSTYIKLIRK